MQVENEKSFSASREEFDYIFQIRSLVQKQDIDANTIKILRYQVEKLQQDIKTSQSYSQSDIAKLVVHKIYQYLMNNSLLNEVNYLSLPILSKIDAISKQLLMTKSQYQQSIIFTASKVKEQCKKQQRFLQVNKVVIFDKLQYLQGQLLSIEKRIFNIQHKSLSSQRNEVDQKYLNYCFHEFKDQIVNPDPLLEKISSILNKLSVIECKLKILPTQYKSSLDNQNEQSIDDFISLSQIKKQETNNYQLSNIKETLLDLLSKDKYCQFEVALRDINYKFDSLETKISVINRNLSFYQQCFNTIFTFSKALTFENSQLSTSFNCLVQKVQNASERITQLSAIFTNYQVENPKSSQCSRQFKDKDQVIFMLQNQLDQYQQNFCAIDADEVLSDNIVLNKENIDLKNQIQKLLIDAQNHNHKQNCFIEDLMENQFSLESQLADQKKLYEKQLSSNSKLIEELTQQLNEERSFSQQLQHNLTESMQQHSACNALTNSQVSQNNQFVTLLQQVQQLQFQLAQQQFSNQQFVESVYQQQSEKISSQLVDGRQNQKLQKFREQYQCEKDKFAKYYENFVEPDNETLRLRNRVAMLESTLKSRFAGERSLLRSSQGNFK